MRPVKLTMQAFGSYGKLTQIDFQEPNQNLFLITGDTGAGKTTIFDAIVFALYGEASSGTNKKDGVVLQSQFVELNVEPFVELVFAEGMGENRQIYTVRRVPRHLKLLTRGAGKNSGTREITGSVSLIMPDGTEYPQKEADSKLNEILGLTKNQFMQVAMIAQGEFMELLRAKSDDKKVIFRKLFNTELYQNIVDELMNRKRSLEKEIAQIKTVCQTETAHVIIPETYEKSQELEGLKKQIKNGEIVVMETFLTELEILCNILENRVKKTQKELKACAKLRDEKRDLYTRAHQLLSLYQQLYEAEKALKECQEITEEMKKQEILCAQIRSAYEVKNEHVRYQDALKATQDHENALQFQKKQKPALEEAAKTDSEQEKQTKELAEQELQSYTVIYERVKTELDLGKKIKAGMIEKQKREAALEAVQEQAKKVKKAQADLEIQENQWRKRIEQLSDVPAQIATWKAECEKYKTLEGERIQLENQNNNREKQQQIAEQKKTEYVKISHLYEAKNQEYETLRRTFLDEQAGFLAMELQPGKPCPVCGSLEHPTPCKASGIHEEITREMLDQLEKEATDLRGKQEYAASDCKVAAKLLESLEAEWEENLQKLWVKVLKEQENTRQDRENIPEHQACTQKKQDDIQQNQKSISADDLPEKTLEQLSEILSAWYQKLNARGKELQAEKKELEKLQKALTSLEEKKQNAKTTLETTNETLTEAISSLKSITRLLEELENSRKYPSEEAARQEYTAAREKNKAAQTKAETAQEKASVSIKAFHNCETLILRYESELPQLKKTCEDRQKSYTEIMEKLDMPEAKWKELSGLHTREEADHLQNRIDGWKQKKTAAQAAHDAARKAIGDQSRPEMGQLEQEMKEAQLQLDTIQKQLENCKEQYKTDKDALDALKPKLEDRGKIIEKHTKLETLYKLLSGNMSGNRMDLETFVQRYYLEKILLAANRRFFDMSAGQFELRMVDAENAGKGKNRGLDLMVYSNVTGKEREVRTLSGGESFMAALSLALGMADQIQESSAAIHLDVMFVDEGFGSLDEHSREQAVKVLQELAGGSKLIGIISHVTELKQEIEDQLIVCKDEKGSHVKWQIS